MLGIQKRLSTSFLALLSLPSTAMGFALSIQISALSWLLSTKYNLDIHEVGIVWAAGPTAGILGQVLIGIISDNVWFWGGRRRPFILIGGVLASLSLLALPNIGFISENSGISILAVAITVALILDLSINISFNPTRSIIADVTTEEKRTKGYTIMQTVSGSFGVLAYAIGAVLNNYILIYVGVFIVFIFSVIPMFFIEEPRVLGDIETDATIVDEIDMIGDSVLIKEEVIVKSTISKKKTDLPNFIKLFIAHMFTWLGVQTMFVYMFAFIRHKFSDFGSLQDAQLNESINNNIGSIIAIAFLLLNLVAAILPAFVLGPIADKIGKVKTHMACIAIMAMAYAGIAFMGHNSTMLYVFMIMAGIGWAAVVSLPFAIMSQQVDQSKMGMYMGIFNLSVVLPQLVASLVVGKVVNDSPDKNLIFIICAVSLAISAVLWLLVKEPENSGDTTSVPSGGGH